MRDPAFWWYPESLVARMLAPLAAVYGAVAERRMQQPGAPAGVPVICIGNLTAGGAGKTPTAIAVAELLRGAGKHPFVLSRGYGGTLEGPVRVDAARHRAADVGDEPLLVARSTPTVIARDRVAGARLARTAGADVIVMDDGFQNPSLQKDLSLIVVDGRRGVGNGCVIPAGPLRAPLDVQMRRADAVLVLGPVEDAGEIIAIAEARERPVFFGRLAPDPAALDALRDRRVLAFAGIGDPQKFFTTLAEAGIEVAEQRAFGDHHRFSAEEAHDLVARAQAHGLQLVTTEKDRMRMAGAAELAALAAAAQTLPVRLDVTEPEKFRTVVLSKVA
jgi:tetraacyldisaccharide 4'-kinase